MSRTMNESSGSKAESSAAFNVDDYYELMKSVMNIDIKPEWEALVKAHLVTAERMAKIVEHAPIENDSLELSNTFKPGIIDVWASP